ncbi:class I SAM-dependent methyltransferase [Nucisporomicrobium flavum]|uniref:class I SAM-dependent methyltransferase n=1 Tax=Nucisporomicrobium flavum TaxID=2785915 RepID=UPI0018F5E32E|nr:class I SAM-dependent methyltransferase [Nucisporomicrobium flavum]
MPTTLAAETQYGFNNRTPEGGKQVGHLAAYLDPHTFAILDGLNLPVGGRYADIGAGAGTVAHWLAEHTGTDGSTLVVDVEPEHVPPHPHIEILQADIATAALKPASFDAIHARLLLMHLLQREQILTSLVDALKPGGMLIISDWATDHLDDMFIDGPAEIRGVFLKFQHALIEVFGRGGMNSTWARRVPAVMRSAGLEVHSGQTFNQVLHGGDAGMLLHASNSRQKEKELLDAGMTAGELELLRKAMGNPDVLTRSWPMHTTVGVRPAA